MEVATITPTGSDWRQIDDIFEDAIGLHRSSLHGVLSGTETYHVLRDGDRIAGVYILRERSLPSTYRDKYRGLGVEGVMLGMRSEYRGQGLGLQLIELPKALGYDYVWGYALDTLNNLEHWKKRREHLETVGGVHLTAELY
jgi:GNAT superfamily N-acetyltransferase